MLNYRLMQTYSQSMTVALTREQAVKVKEACPQLLQENAITIREVAKVLGLLTSLQVY